MTGKAFRMEKLLCYICHNDVRVPVFFESKCFPCPKNRGKRSCHSTLRTCVVCARTFLDLNKPRAERKEWVKCLLCPTVCYPQKLRGDDAYTKDFSYMSLDKRADYPCFHEDRGCAFKGSQNELDRHLQEACDYRFTVCRCGCFHRIVDGPAHSAVCPFFTVCKVCQVCVLNEQYDDHLRSVHDLMACRHIGCDMLTPSADLERHMVSQCEYRSVFCLQCQGYQRRCDFQAHLQQHVEQNQKRLTELMETMNAVKLELNRSLQHWETCMSLSLTEVMDIAPHH